MNSPTVQINAIERWNEKYGSREPVKVTYKSFIATILSTYRSQYFDCSTTPDSINVEWPKEALLKVSTKTCNEVEWFWSTALDCIEAVALQLAMTPLEDRGDIPSTNPEDWNFQCTMSNRCLGLNPSTGDVILIPENDFDKRRSDVEAQGFLFDIPAQHWMPRELDNFKLLGFPAGVYLPTGEIFKSDGNLH